MAEKSDTGQSAARLLRVVAALASGEMIRTTNHPEGVEVIAIERDNWPEAPVMVTLATSDGRETVALDGIELAEVERVEVGADGCGCPVTEEIRPNSSSVEGTERTEHRAGCWSAAQS